MTYYSQAGQDKWVYQQCGSEGVFVDLGAYDGIQTSNTYLLEQLGWTGICIEGNPFYASLCKTRRKCVTVEKAVSNFQGELGFGEDQIGGDIIVPCDTLAGILRSNLCPRNIDYLSMDIEGHELTVLNVFPFSDYNIRLITIEHNLYCDGPEKKDALFSLLTANGFTRVKEDVPCLDPNPLYYMKPYEDWYENPFYKS